MKAGLSVSNRIWLRRLGSVYDCSLSSTLGWLTLHGWLGRLMASQSEHHHSGHGPSLIYIILQNTEVTVDINPHQKHSWLEQSTCDIVQQCYTMIQVFRLVWVHSDTHGHINSIFFSHLTDCSLSYTNIYTDRTTLEADIESWVTDTEIVFTSNLKGTNGKHITYFIPLSHDILKCQRAL